MNGPLWEVKMERPIYKAQLTYGNLIFNITKKPNILMRWFLKMIGIKVKLHRDRGVNNEEKIKKKLTVKKNNKLLT